MIDVALAAAGLLEPAYILGLVSNGVCNLLILPEGLELTFALTRHDLDPFHLAMTAAACRQSPASNIPEYTVAEREGGSGKS